MTTVRPDNNLPTSSQPWGREIQKKLEELDRNFNLEKINSATVNAQLQSSYRRLDLAVRDIDNVSYDINQITEVSDQAVSASNEALAGLNSLRFEGSSYKVNASNIIDGRIDGGTA
jgi:hypothetical protein